MNYLWGGMMVVGVVYAVLTGNLDAVTEQALVSAKEAISLCLTMAGAMAFWVGIMRIADRAGMIERAAQRMGPLLTFLFPSVPKSGKARIQIATNIVANVLGLGWAATPAGLSAMKELRKLEADTVQATDAMCDFLILNILIQKKNIFRVINFKKIKSIGITCFLPFQRLQQYLL